MKLTKPLKWYAEPETYQQLLQKSYTYLHCMFVLALSPGFPFQILSHNFGEKSETKSRTEIPGFEAVCAKMILKMMSDVQVCHQRLSSAFDLLIFFLFLTLTPPPKTMYC